MDGKPCCTPQRGTDPAPTDQPQNLKSASETRPVFEAAAIPGGKALIGTNTPLITADEESPCRTTRVKPFAVMTTSVTNAQYQAFVDDTGYISDAERFGWSFVFYQNVSEKIEFTQAVAEANWWRKVEGAMWKSINGPEDTAWYPDHPVVHVSWNDAQAFAKWAGGRLPTEAEWEHAARGGLGDVLFPWGNDLPEDDPDFQPCNIWQGQFPKHNTAQDGYTTTAPAKSFQPNGYGLFNIVGNVWEWTNDPFKRRSLSKAARQHNLALKGQKVTKGGSYLCHRSYCTRYRIAARTNNTPDTSTAHQGMRLVFDV